ncbi:hypothetical protein GCM10010168_74020 [Actinoplanes ianthinogenes]|uniref:DUF4240 domain-containing protein n=1 Tax=Actinoplanes ianthinogenes TaxID=122358 RepID=A0ABN6C543_9ACTN|nr:DUF4240 domain-containing protein [Actinoplanes ianthinogenes]BCJ40610.1 hypothetical protein Aiant_12670 [Actinoplanes ianthinogenes]GGR44127.1 hypothetical protein GCM10010168_74020 [Actinoplanes ianthinogenes]
MDTARCWQIIEAARADAGPGWAGLDDRLEEALVTRLVELSLEELIGFEMRFAELQRGLDRPDVFLAAFLIGGGCEDDTFTDFRAGMVGLGHDWYHRVLSDPDQLADHPAVHAVAAGTIARDTLMTEGFQFAPMEAYERLTGDDEGFWAALDRAEEAAGIRHAEPAGTVPARLDRLAALFPDSRRLLDRHYPHLTSY